ncbi:YVTN repeat-like/Quino protein amine dehydrogenase [Suillus brevipes Sb2]|nr:YVTN repeat-like/Quino protein amine dehydrogenase [Suillus brevipes Sb2]
MASTSTQPVAIADKSILTPVITLEGHELWNVSLPDGEQHEGKYAEFISYFPDGKQMISGSRDKTIRRWDMRKGKEIEKDRQVVEGVHGVGVSRDGRWVVIAGKNDIKVSEVKTGIARTFHEDDWILFIDISADSTLLACASFDGVQVWNLDTGELVAGPFDIGQHILPRALRFSEDSRKLAVSSYVSEELRHLEVWDVQTQKLDAQKSTRSVAGLHVPIFWTTKDKSIVAVFTLTLRTQDDDPTMIYEFDASTLKTVGAPFKHNPPFNLALSSDCGLLASSSCSTIKLWAFESRQLLASFDVESARTLVLSPDSRQLAYTTFDDTKIRICDIPANILASIESINKSKHPDLLNSDATRCTVHRKPVIIPVRSSIPQPLPTSDPHPFPRLLRKLIPFSSRTHAVHTEPRNLLDFPATSPLPRSHISRTAVPPTTQSSVINTSSTLSSRLYRLWPLQTNHASPTIVDVPLAPGKLRIATAGAPSDDDDLIRDEDYVSPPPSPNLASRPGIVNTGQHGSGRFCFCF